MRFMNTYDIDDRARQYANHPVLGPATRTIASLRDAANANSDGWAYWPKPARAAAKLMGLIEGDGLDPRNVRFDTERADATPDKLKVALRPVKAFRTKSGIDFAIYDGGAGDAAVLVKAARQDGAQLLTKAIAALLATSAGLSDVGDDDTADKANDLAQGAIGLWKQITGE